MKLFFIVVLSFVYFVANAQKEKFSIAVQAQPEVTFYESSYTAVYPPAYSKSSFNTGFNIYGQYQLTDRLFTTLGLGFISRRLNTETDFTLALLPPPYYDSILPAFFTGHVSYRVLQIPVGLGYSVFKTKKTKINAGVTLVPNFLLNANYGRIRGYPAFKKNYWQGYSVNPNIGFDHSLINRIDITGGIAYSVVNTVRAEEYSKTHPKLEHKYLQLSLGLKLKFYKKINNRVPLCPVSVN